MIRVRPKSHKVRLRIITICAATSTVTRRSIVPSVSRPNRHPVTATSVPSSLKIRGLMARNLHAMDTTVITIRTSRRIIRNHPSRGPAIHEPYGTTLPLPRQRRQPQTSGKMANRARG